MLVLSRRIRESLKIGDHITVTVLSIHGSYVRLGIVAPGEVPIHREEVFFRIKAGLRAAEHGRRSGHKSV